MAKRVKFKVDHDYAWRTSETATPHAYTAFKAGEEYTVKDEVAAAVVPEFADELPRGKAPLNEPEQPSGE